MLQGLYVRFSVSGKYNNINICSGVGTVAAVAALAATLFRP